MKNLKDQEGMTTSGAMFVLLVVFFVATVFIKVGPAYTDFYSLKKTMSSVQAAYKGSDLQDIGDEVIMGKVVKHLQVNQVSKEAANSLEIIREGTSVYLVSSYEERNSFMGNIDVVVVFEHEVDLAE